MEISELYYSMVNIGFGTAQDCTLNDNLPKDLYIICTIIP
jgi:hypothetical protein